MHRIFRLGLTLSLGCAPLLKAAETAHPERQLDAARQALAQGLAEVAALKAGRLLKAEGLTSSQRAQAAGLAVESWVRAGQGNLALEALAIESSIADKEFWQAQALALAGRYEEARKLLEERLGTGQARLREKLLLVRLWLQAHQTQQARELLASMKEVKGGLGRQARLMLDELELNAGQYEAVLADLNELPELVEDNPARLLRVRALMELQRYPQAERSLRNILATPAIGERIHHAASLLLGETLQRQDRAQESLEVLVQFLDHTAQSQLWPQSFDLLNRVLTTGPAAPLPPDALLRWMLEGNSAQKRLLRTLPQMQDFKGHAILLTARWLLAQERPQEALGWLEAMLKLYPDHPQVSEGMRLALETYGRLQVDSRVAALAGQWRQQYGGGQSAMVDFVTGGTAFSRGDRAQAARLFQSAANVAVTLAERRTALYNAAVAAFKAGETALYQSLLGQLEVVSASPAVANNRADSVSDLELDQALDAAARGLAGSADLLRQFLEKNPAHPRQAQARLALAETLLTLIPTDFAAITATLEAADASAQLTPAHQQQAAVIRLWMLDKQGQLKSLAEQGAAFLDKWPDAPQAASIRMKVADAYYRLENFANARTEFELVAQEHPDSPYVETALYFAGMAALSMMSDEGRETAIDHWQAVAERGGPLSIPARQQQALAKRRAGQQTEALTLLDSLLKENDLPADTRRSLLCEQAEILMLLGKSDPAQLEKAVTALRSLLKEDRLPYLWYSRGGYTLAAVLQAAGRTPEALEACYDVVAAQGYMGPANPAEYRWFYRAGFFGIDLLESRQDWEAAARLAEQLARSNGERANEARELATRIRLEHFLWDGGVR